MKKISSAIVIFALVCIVLFAQDAMMINIDGNVGIGTDTPSEKLEVAGNIVAQGNIKAEVPIAGVTDPVLRDIIEALCPVGTILAYGGTTEPNGFLFCNGSAISRSLNAELFAVIGTNFGAGDGSNTFNLPDLRGIFLRGAENGSTLNNGKLTKSNGGGFSADLGVYQIDQSHSHHHVAATAKTGSGAEYPNQPPLREPDSQYDGTSRKYHGIVRGDYDQYVLEPDIDGTNGVPRMGDETRPANVGVNYIIKK